MLEHPVVHGAQTGAKLAQIERTESKHEFHLRPHAADAAVGIIPIEKVRGRRADHAFLWNLRELRVIQRVESLPAKVQSPRLADLE